MDRQQLKQVRRTRRRAGIRKRIAGTPTHPRLSVYRSLSHMYAQVIDDLGGRTIVAASTLDKEVGAEGTGNRTAAAAVGRLVAERALAAGIERVQFDRGGFRYHGRVQALADAAREAGLKF